MTKTNLIFLFLVLSPFFGIPPSAFSGEKEYVASLAREIVQNLEKQVKEGEHLVTLDLFKTKKENKIIPLSRLLRDELLKQLEQSSKVTLPFPPGTKTEYTLAGFIRVEGEKAELYAKIIDNKTGKKVASHEIKPLETKWPSLYQEHFDDHLQKLVEDTKFAAIDQNFFVEAPLFQGAPEPKLGEYIRTALGGMWAKAYQNVFDKKGPSVPWTVKTEIGRAGTEYHVKMVLVTDVGNQDYTMATASIPIRLAPFHLKGVAGRKFILVSRAPNGYPHHQETLKTRVGGFLESRNISWVNDASLNKAALQWLEDRSGKALADAADYVVDAQFLVEITEPKGGEAAGGVKGTLRLNVYDTGGGLKTTADIAKGGIYVDRRGIEKEVEKITRNIQGQLPNALEDKFSGL